jgi:ketosteroid isomerase-like protein
MPHNARASVLSLVLTLVAALPVSAIASEKGRAADEKAILELEAGWNDALRARDAAALDAILADDWVGISPFGTSTKAQALGDLKSGDMKVESIGAPHDMKVRFYGDVAIVMGASEEKSSWKGKDTSGNWVFMDVWTKRGGKWRCVASQSSLLAAK